MSIDKVSFKQAEIGSKPQNSQYNEKVEESGHAEDTEKNNAAKYMIGLTALAGAVAVGIIGHKNNWWRNAAKEGENLKGGLSNSLKEGGENLNEGRPLKPEQGTVAPVKQPQNEFNPDETVQPEIVNPKTDENAAPSPLETEKPHIVKQLEGKELIDKNLETLNSEMNFEDIHDILHETSYEISKLPEHQQIEYVNKYLSKMKNLSESFPDELDEYRDLCLFDFGGLLGCNNEKAAKAVLDFVKENPKFQGPAIKSLIVTSSNDAHAADNQLNEEALNIRKMIFESDVNPKGIYMLPFRDILKYDHVEEWKRNFLRTSLKYDLKVGMNEIRARNFLDEMWKNPKRFKECFGIDPLRIESAVKKSYTELTGKRLDYTSAASNEARLAAVRSQGKPYIDAEMIDVYLAPKSKKDAWSFYDMKKYYKTLEM